MKKVVKIILIIFTVLSLIGYVGYEILNGPSVSIKEKKEIKKYVENYLTKKYGEHKYKITDIRYEYNMAYVFDYSNPKGYWVDFKSDIVPSSWVTIKGLTSEDYKVDSDYFIQNYYFPGQDGYDVSEIMEDMEPKEEIKKNLLDKLRNEFDTNIYEVKDSRIILNIPEDYGRIPTLKELKTDINLYKVISFDYKVSNAIKDTNEYKERLKAYIKNKYNSDSDIYFYKENTLISVSLN